MDGTLHAWNISTGQEIAIHEREGALYGAEWNHNGSMIGFTSKERHICVFDPRKNQIAMEVNAYDGNKTSRMNFMGNTDLIVCTGHSKNNDRQIKIFDMKKFDEPLQTLNVDHQSYTCQNYYDADTSLLFIPGRGESSCKYYELVNGAFKKAAEYTSPDAARSCTFMAKRFVNYNKCELNTMVKLTKNWVGFVHFYYPKKVKEIFIFIYLFLSLFIFKG
jgi:coronin-1B/1C/6